MAIWVVVKMKFVLTIMRNNLKRFETTWNNLQRPETTYKKQETTWNDLQQARNGLKWPKISKKQPTTSWTYIQRAKEESKLQTISRIWDYFTVWVIRFFLQHFSHPIFDFNRWRNASCRILVKTECQTFMYNYMYVLRDTEFVGYLANHFDIHKLTIARQKLTIWVKLDIKIKFWHKNYI